MSEITVLEFPSNLGLIEPAPHKEPGVKILPEWLNKHHFHDLLKPAQTIRLNPPPYSMLIDKETQVRNADTIIEYAEKQAEILLGVFKENRFAVVIGGDCSILIGNALALTQKGNFGLFFLDGHTDFMFPDLSTTKGAAGMDLAIVTGNGHEKLVNIHGKGPYIQEDNVWCVGNREFDEDYINVILSSDIHYFDLHKLRLTGISDCCFAFLEMISEKKLDGFWIHLDVDVLDDELMPAVDSRSPGGLSYAELTGILEILLVSGLSVGIEITILDPDLDQTGYYTKNFVGETARLISDIVSDKQDKSGFINSD